MVRPQATQAARQKMPPSDEATSVGRDATVVNEIAQNARNGAATKAGRDWGS